MTALLVRSRGLYCWMPYAMHFLRHIGLNTVDGGPVWGHACAGGIRGDFLATELWCPQYIRLAGQTMNKT